MDFDAFDFFRLAFDEDKRCMSSCLMTAQRHRHIASMRWHARQVNDERRGRIAETIAKRLGSGLAVINLVSGGAQFGDLLFGFFGFPVNQAYTMHIRGVGKMETLSPSFESKALKGFHENFAVVRILPSSSAEHSFIDRAAARAESDDYNLPLIGR